MLFDTVLALHEAGKFFKDIFISPLAPSPLSDLSSDEVQKIDTIAHDLLNHFLPRLNSQISPCRVVFRVAKPWQDVIDMLDRHETGPHNEGWKISLHYEIAKIQYWHNKAPSQNIAPLGVIYNLLGNYPYDCAGIVDYVKNNWDGLSLVSRFSDIPFDKEEVIVEVTHKKRKELVLPDSIESSFKICESGAIEQKTYGHNIRICTTEVSIEKQYYKPFVQNAPPSNPYDIYEVTMSTNTEVVDHERMYRIITLAQKKVNNCLQNRAMQ